MKHKVSELEGALLDAAVAKAAGLLWRTSADILRVEVQDTGGQWMPFAPSLDGRDGIEIIDRVGIDLEWAPNSGFAWWPESEDGDTWRGSAPTRDGLAAQTGPTPLIAAMRAYVASKFGEEVDL